MTKYLFLLILMILYGCSKDEDSLTSPTQDGEQTISFLLDGSVWVPHFNEPFWPPGEYLKMVVGMLPQNPDSNLNKTNEYIKIFISTAKQNTGYFQFEVDSILNEGIYSITNALYINDSNNDTFNIDNNSRANKVNITKIMKYYVSSYYSSQLEKFTYPGAYSDSSIISGKFELIFKNRTGKVLHISEGRFDSHPTNGPFLLQLWGLKY